ncbi:energy-coupling factor transporter transmembrane protein EcfT [Methanoculleus sp. FWC-SCC1]|uniref:Energy-coupling factor transporter transmembrane protein EcfT n=1 Tax=Methanoculleus frigidifontis TaxID=2584085 RepID=A0ABT8MBF5_9EURY|nr:energy-coupling factor transporter transmembrane component T [Methanoculleus sp. FWC-SCC1]MDN7025262.1 energy-coupling factor transporter transmembrane protein EcfT [Methanoculleus sp. FWC-SCC1]
MPEIMQYINRDSYFHRVNPLTKVVFTVVVVVLAVILTDVAALTLLVGLILLAAAVSGLARELLRQAPLLVSLAVSLLLLTVLTLQSGEVLGYLIPIFGGYVPITTGAVDLAASMTLRFVAMIFAFQLFIVSTQPRDLVQVMDRLHMPVDYTLMFLIALRFIPSLQLEGKRIHEAQLARAYAPGKGLMGKIRSLFPVVIPLVSNSLGKANVLGLTIDLRGYRNGMRTSMRDLGFGTADGVGFALMGVCTAGFVALILLQSA